MILDNEQQRQFLLQMMDQVNFPGSLLDVAFNMKRAIMTGGIGVGLSAVSSPQPTDNPTQQLADASN